MGMEPAYCWMDGHKGKNVIILLLYLHILPPLYLGCLVDTVDLNQHISIIKGSLGGETSVLRTFRMSGKELVKERVRKERVRHGKSSSKKELVKETVSQGKS
jgi:hypothetical protein